MKTGIAETSATWGAIALGGTWEWYVVARNAYGSTGSEKRSVSINGETVMAIGDSVAAGFGLPSALSRTDIAVICKFIDMPIGNCDATDKAWPTLVANSIARRRRCVR